jgi:hypothetical protein
MTGEEWDQSETQLKTLEKEMESIGAEITGLYRES